MNYKEIQDTIKESEWESLDPRLRKWICKECYPSMPCVIQMFCVDDHFGLKLSYCPCSKENTPKWEECNHV